MIPELEDRFLPPKNWKQYNFFNKTTGHKINYAYMETSRHKNNLFILPGLSEFSEKYIETAKLFHSQGFNIYIIDWCYQGRSTRFIGNPEKRYSDGYEADISDLKLFLKINNDSSKDNFMLCHSMGAHTAIRYLSENQHDIKAASFSAPMLNIKSLSPFSNIYCLLKLLLKPFAKFYVPGGSNWRENDRQNEDIFSSDPIRKNIHFEWALYNPELRVGNATNRWLIESLKSIKKLNSQIQLPCLIALAEKEQLICNKAIKNFATGKNNIKVLELKNSKHEIMMETDDIRDLFLDETLSLFKKAS